MFLNVECVSALLLMTYGWVCFSGVNCKQWLCWVNQTQHWRETGTKRHDWNECGHCAALFNTRLSHVEYLKTWTLWLECKATQSLAHQRLQLKNKMVKDSSLALLTTWIRFCMQMEACNVSEMQKVQGLHAGQWSLYSNVHIIALSLSHSLKFYNIKTDNTDKHACLTGTRKQQLSSREGLSCQLVVNRGYRNHFSPAAHTISV